jgi:hypothetical protein
LGLLCTHTTGSRIAYGSIVVVVITRFWFIKSFYALTASTRHAPIAFNCD